MTLRRIAFTVLGAAGVLGLSLPASAQMGNLTYLAGELEKPLASFDEASFGGPPGGSNTVLMLRKRMIVMGSHDGGKPDGPLHVFDVSDPRKPALLKRYTSPETADLRELHAMPVALLDGKDILVFPTTKGIRFFDFTDPINPVPIGVLPLAGVNAGDYDNAAWMVSWAWPYVYVGGTGNGVYVVDATDPTKPTLVTRILTGELGNFRVGPVYAAGNYIIGTSMDGTLTEVAVLDAGDPTSPLLLAKGTAPKPTYSAVVIGDRIYGAGEGGNYSFMKWNATTVDLITEKKFGSDKGGYCTYQDGFVFCGQSSEGYRKLDVNDEANITQVGAADIASAGADTDFATVLGNLVYLGNDHGSGAAFIPHAMAPDTVAPKVLKTYPENGELNQPLTSRITLFFSDEIEIDSITPENIVVKRVGGEVVDGVFSHSSFNAVSFGARAPLEADSTYEVLVVKGGLLDLAQNPIEEELAVRFSTGDTISELPSGNGGSGGSGGSGSPAGGAGGSAGGASSGGMSPSDGGGKPATAGSSGSASVTPPKDDNAKTDSGCGCSVPGSSAPNTAWGVAALAGWALALRGGGRRRRQGPSRP